MKLEIWKQIIHLFRRLTLSLFTNVPLEEVIEIFAGLLNVFGKFSQGFQNFFQVFILKLGLR